jgi:hypothetical protein
LEENARCVIRISDVGYLTKKILQRYTLVPIRFFVAKKSANRFQFHFNEPKKVNPKFNDFSNFFKYSETRHLNVHEFFIKNK